MSKYYFIYATVLSQNSLRTISLIIIYSRITKRVCICTNEFYFRNLKEPENSTNLKFYNQF